MWSGAVDAVPEGWLLCDGENGTPDLRDRFIVGAGNSYAVGAAGGATTHNHGGVTGNTTITTATMPAHGHAITLGQLGNFNNSNGGRAWTSYTTTDNIRYTNTDAGSGGAHNHNISAVDNRPPYYALAYIMKL
jgi:microcystin-dependent protein